MSFRIFLFCSMVLLCGSVLQGQTSGVSFTLQAGPAFSTVQPDPKGFIEQKFRGSFFAGASVNWTLSEHWEVPVELQFSQRGFYYETPGTFVLIDNQIALFRGRVDYRLSYLDIAPKVEFRPFYALGIAAGPYLSYRLGESVRYKDLVDWTSTKDDKLYKDTDFGLMAKLSGYVGPVSVFAAFQYGLANISNLGIVDDNGQALGKLGLKSRALFVGVGWRI